MLLYVTHVELVGLQTINHERRCTDARGAAMRTPDGYTLQKPLRSPDTAPERLETGTQNHEGLVGAAAAVDFLADLWGTRDGSRRERLARVFAVLHERGERLLADLWEGLERLPRVRCYGPRPGAPRTPTIAFSVEGVWPADVARALAARGVFVSHGSFYAEGVLARLGRAHEGLVRAGCACYTTQDEVDRLVAAVRTLVVG